MSEPAPIDEVIADMASEALAAEFAIRARPRREAQGDGLDGVEHGGVRLPLLVQSRIADATSFWKRASEATVADLRVHARLSRFDPTTRRASSAWLAIADRMAAAGAAPDDLLVDAARRLP